MNKLIFRKFSLDIVNFFLLSSFSITFIVWIIQAVNFLDLVSDDGHSLNVYFYYVSLNLPKIFSKTIIFVFFISIFYVVNKYNNSNELIVFWSNGIKKIHFINFILKFSILFLVLQLFLNLLVIPKSQSLGRIFIKESNIDFFSLTGFKDLLLNENEHHFDLLQIREILHDLSLNFCGFEFTNHKRMQNEIKLQKNDFNFHDLNEWHNFEINNPKTFSGMYQFWCQKC